MKTITNLGAWRNYTRASVDTAKQSLGVFSTQVPACRTRLKLDDGLQVSNPAAPDPFQNLIAVADSETDEKRVSNVDSRWSEQTRNNRDASSLGGFDSRAATNFNLATDTTTRLVAYMMAAWGVMFLALVTWWIYCGLMAR